MKSKKLLVPAIIIFFCALYSLPAFSAANKAEDVVKGIYNTFIKHNFKSITYDEIRMTYYEYMTDENQGLSAMDDSNGTTMKMRYFYQAPDKHGYKLLSKPIDNYWIGSPNQPGALPMDTKWLGKLLAWYNLYPGKDTVVNGAKCFAISLIPKDPKNENLYPMTWYVDKEKYAVIKFQYLIAREGKKIHTTGLIDFKKINGFWFPAKATWKTSVAEMPYFFMHKSEFLNYQFNIPLDKSVFNEEFPENWFENRGEKPYAPPKK